MHRICAREGRRRPPLSFVPSFLSPPVVRLLWACLACVLAVPAWAGSGFFLRLDSESYSEPVSLDAALNDWQGHFYGGEAQWSINWLESGYRRGVWGISALYRRDLWLGFAADTAELYYRTDHRLPLQTGRQYAVDITAYGFSARGARGSWRQAPLPGLSLTWGLSLFNAGDLLDGRLHGRATALAENEYAYEAAVDYTYAEDVLFDRQVEAPDGVGASLDLAVAYAFSAQTRLRLRVTDLFGRIRWRQAPYTRATANSNQQGYDETGYIVVRPALSGIEAYHATYLQRLRPRGSLALEQDLTPTLRAGLRYRHRFDEGVFGLAGDWRSGGQRFGIQLWPRRQALGLSWAWRRLAVGLTLDAPQWKDLRTLWLALRIE